MFIHRLGFTIGAISIGAISIAVGASAQLSTPFLTPPPNTIGLSPIVGEITNVQAVRIPVDKATTGAETRITLNFKLQGCVDSLMPLITHSEIQGRRATIYVTALNAHNETSKVARCIAIPQAKAQVTLPGIFQRNQIRMVFMGQPPESDR